VVQRSAEAEHLISLLQSQLSQLDSLQTIITRARNGTCALFAIFIKVALGMTNREAIFRLKQAGVRNYQIAALLNVSKQYVSRVSQELGCIRQRPKDLSKDGFATVGFASRLLDVDKTTVRRWSDEGRIRSFRSNSRTRHRVFLLAHLWLYLHNAEAEKANHSRSHRLSI
jgi:hypothetical protein